MNNLYSYAKQELMKIKTNPHEIASVVAGIKIAKELSLQSQKQYLWNIFKYIGKRKDEIDGRI